MSPLSTRTPTIVSGCADDAERVLQTTVSASTRSHNNDAVHARDKAIHHLILGIGSGGRTIEQRTSFRRPMVPIDWVPMKLGRVVGKPATTADIRQQDNVRHFNRGGTKAEPAS
jgi:hypothetical protein